MYELAKSIALLTWSIITTPRQSDRERDLAQKLRRAELELEAYRVIDRTRIGWVRDLERNVQS